MVDNFLFLQNIRLHFLRKKVYSLNSKNNILLVDNRIEIIYNICKEK